MTVSLAFSLEGYVIAPPWKATPSFRLQSCPLPEIAAFPWEGQIIPDSAFLKKTYLLSGNLRGHWSILITFIVGLLIGGHRLYSVRLQRVPLQALNLCYMEQQDQSDFFPYCHEPTRPTVRVLRRPVIRPDVQLLRLAIVAEGGD